MCLLKFAPCACRMPCAKVEDFAFVGLQECFPESLAMLGKTIPWAAEQGGLEV